MKKVTNLIYLILFSFSINFLSEYFLNAESFIAPITSSTTFSQDISSLTPSVQVITSKDIELLGVENIPELLNLVNGIMVERANGVTADIYMRGFIPELRLNPLVLVDGMEIAENFYNRTYFYDLPVTIDDIDRIEIIKTTSSNSNGYIEPAGIINIVTKKAQFLDNNYFSATKGSRNLDKINFSLNSYNLSTYWKLTGEYRGIDDFNDNHRIDKFKMLNLSIDKYIGNSKLFIKGSISESDLNFLESYPVGVNHNMYSLKLHENLNNFKIKNLLINYKYPHIDSSIYYQEQTGYVDIRFKDSIESEEFLNEFYKFSFRYSLNNFLIGVEAKYYHAYIENMTSCYDYIFSPFLSYKLRILKNFNLSFTLRNDTIRNSGSNFNYKFNIGYVSRDNSFELNAGYSKSIKPVSLYAKYTDYTASIPLENINFPANVNLIANLHNNKHIRPPKIYTTDISISKKWKNFILKTTFFYNRITDTIATNGVMNFSLPLTIDFYNINLINYSIHGVESSVTYLVNSHFKVFSSYILQNMKNKTMDIRKDYYLPKYKITGGILFENRIVSGSLTGNYIPAIHAYEDGKSDYIFSINTNLIKKFLNNRLVASFHAENLFNDVHKETYYGEKIERLVYFKIKYTF